jgi:hypothetical protein
LLLLLAACGGSGSGNGGGTAQLPPGGSPGPACALADRAAWAKAQIDEWYLFPETLPAALDPAGFQTLDAYVDALTATARQQGRDRFFTFVTSIAEEEAFFARGTTAAFGIRIETADDRVRVLDAYEGAPALAAGIDRGAEILAIGPTEAGLVDVAQLVAAGGSALTDAFGPAEAGVTRSLRVRDAGGTRVLTIAKAVFDIQPISPLFGVRVLADGPTRVGYVNLRTFIQTADPALRQAFARFRADGITRVILDFRYNGGGLVSGAELLGDLMAENRLASDVFSFTVYRPSKAGLDSTRRFVRQPQSIGPTRLAVISTGETASASELVANAMTPWLREASALVGENSFGKPVGQIARDRAACDDRLRIVAFQTLNADRRGDYFQGLAGEVAASCAAADDLSRPMGDPDETMTAAALDHLAGRPCPPIPVGAVPQAFGEETRRQRPVPTRPTVAQRELPGTF